MEQHTTSQSSEDKPEAGHQFFDWLRSTGVRRPEGGWIGGVFAGISERTGWDAALLRGLGVVALILFASPAAMLYGLAWLLVPNQHGEIHAQSAVRGQVNGAVLAGGFLAVVGAANVFTPINIAGPFAILVNLVIIGAAAWGTYVLVKNHRKGSRRSSDDAGSGAESPRREDGRPAWYPKESQPEPAAPAAQASPAQAPARPGYEHGYEAPGRKHSSGRRTASEDPGEREERRRRRMVTWGLLLLIIPATAGLALVSGLLGLSTMKVLALGTAALVILLSARHMAAAARGRRGNGFLLACAAVVMVLLTLTAPGPGQSAGSSANHLFGNYTTNESSTNTAFSNTTMDLRHLTPGDQEGITTHHTEVNMAFGNTTVVVPDETRVLISNGHTMGNLTVNLQDESFGQSQMGGADLTVGPEDAENEIALDLNSAFGNIDIYDATTYEHEVEQP